MAGVLSREERLRFLRALEEDVEFRYAVAGVIGLGEILRRLDRHEERFEEIFREISRLREDMNRGFARHDEEFKRIWEEIARLREDMMKGFARHDEEIGRIWEEIAKLREDMMRGFERHDEELKRLREDMVKGFARHDEEFRRVWEEMARLREDMQRGFARHGEELRRLREDMMRGFELMKRHLDALGTRWGMMSEGAFREGLRGIVEKELGLRVEKWVYYDGEGYVYGLPSTIDVDVAIKDDKVILVEVKAHIDRSDVAIFKKKAELYERVTGKRVDRLVMVSPYVDGGALEACKRLDVEVYTGV